MKYLRILLTVAVAFAAAIPATADTTIGTPIASLPVLISKPGKYRVTKSLVMSGANTAIVVLARDVVIDLNGFSITGTPDVDSDNVCIVVNAPNTIIRNGTIRKFDTAISDLAGAYGTTVEDVFCLGQASTGIRFAAAESLLRRVVVRSVGAQDDSPDAIFGFNLSGNSVITDCLIQNIPVRAGVTANVGIRLAGGSHIIRDTEVHRALGTGVAINADTSTIVERLRVRECGTGLTVSGGKIPLLRDSTIRDCITSTSGTFDDGGRNSID